MKNIVKIVMKGENNDVTANITLVYFTKIFVF
jgi:hypothetical protein